jgi:hypothetical protein
LTLIAFSTVDVCVSIVCLRMMWYIILY